MFILWMEQTQNIINFTDDKAFKACQGWGSVRKGKDLC